MTDIDYRKDIRKKEEFSFDIALGTLQERIAAHLFLSHMKIKCPECRGNKSIIIFDEKFYKCNICDGTEKVTFKQWIKWYIRELKYENGIRK